jgi:hypothetical protein
MDSRIGFKIFWILINDFGLESLGNWKLNQIGSRGGAEIAEKANAAKFQSCPV